VNALNSVLQTSLIFSPDIFAIDDYWTTLGLNRRSSLRWRREILRALMAFHLIGFQTKRDQRNFVACVRRHFSDFMARRIGEAYL
jgi:hypothetical protein